MVLWAQSTTQGYIMSGLGSHADVNQRISYDPYNNYKLSITISRTYQDGTQDFEYWPKDASLKEGEHFGSHRRAERIGHIVGSDPEGEGEGNDETNDDNPQPLRRNVNHAVAVLVVVVVVVVVVVEVVEVEERGRR